MTVFIPIPVYKRPEILIECVEGMKRFIRKSKRINIVVWFIVSPDDYFFKVNEFIIQESGFHIVYYKNLPVGEKMNAAINLALSELKFDYLMNCGSDNILNPEIWKEYKPLMSKKRQFFGLRNFYCYGTVEKEAIYFDNYNKNRAIGTARMIHINSIKKLDKKEINLYDNNINSGLDTSSGNRILEHCNIKEVVVNSKHPYTLGIKSATNINPFPHLLTRRDKIKYIEFNDIKKYFYD